mmetsp:Transcript_8423/g.21576  ORF Transcript_8423/g.21576 Transcript_8423/m.21576 type:complete len:502 (-) Transcript_8423:77-1582(-)
MGSSLSAVKLVAQLKGGSKKGEEAADSLCQLARNVPEKRDDIAKAGGIPPLVAMLKNEATSDKGKEWCAAALGLLALSMDSKAEVAKAGAIEPLVALCDQGTPGCKGAAATALSSLASKSIENQGKIAEAGGIAALVQLAKDSTAVMQVRGWASAAIGNLALENPRNQNAVADAGGIEVLAELLVAIVPEPEAPASSWFVSCRRRWSSAAMAAKRTEDSRVCVTKALSSLAYKNDANQMRILEAGAFAPLVKMIKLEPRLGRLEAMKALCNMTGRREEDQRRLMEADAIPGLVAELGENASQNRKAFAAGLLGNLAKGNKEYQNAVAKSGALEKLTWQLHTGSDETKLYSAMALCRLAEDNYSIKTYLGQEDGIAIPGLLKLIDGESARARPVASRALQALAANHEENQKRIRGYCGNSPTEVLASKGMKVTELLDGEEIPLQMLEGAQGSATEGALPTSAVTPAEETLCEGSDGGSLRRRVAAAAASEANSGGTAETAEE